MMDKDVMVIIQKEFIYIKNYEYFYGKRGEQKMRKVEKI